MQVTFLIHTSTGKIIIYYCKDFLSLRKYENNRLTEMT